MTDTPAAPTTPRKALEIAEFHHQQHRDITAIQSWQDCTAWPCRAVAEARSTPIEPLDAERPTDAEVTAELHRVLCMNAKHRSPFTGQCSAGPNVARGLRARLREARPSSGCRHQWTHIGGYPDEPEGLAYDMCSKCGKVKGHR